LLLEGGDEDEARILGAPLPVAIGGMAAGVGAAHREAAAGVEEEKQASALRSVLLHRGRNTPQESGVEDAGEDRSIECVFASIQGVLRKEGSFLVPELIHAILYRAALLQNHRLLREASPFPRIQVRSRCTPAHVSILPKKERTPVHPDVR